MTHFHAIKIDPATGHITDITLNEADQLAQFYALINCANVDAIELPNGDTCWIDDSGLDNPERGFSLVPFHTDPIAGVCIIAGTAWDDQGDKLTEVKTTVEELLATVQFKSHAELVALYQSGALA